MKKCLVHPDCKATVRVNHVDICYECWNNANAEERGWFTKAIRMYNYGLITREELDDCLSSIGFHEVDPTFPIHL
ncbi:unnamed protein product [marine sediment metagenome]|uniref:Uncharacterized protein n=1 Tax=marine sediment metagenome TaxID=412755 RepID=X1G082_9ZZZZ